MALRGGKKVKKKTIKKNHKKKNHKKRNHKKSQKHSNKGKKYSIKKKKKMKGGMDKNHNYSLRPRENTFDPNSYANYQYDLQKEAERKARENPRRKSTGKNNPYYTRGWNKKPENFDPNKYNRVSVDNTPGPRPPGSMKNPPTQEEMEKLGLYPIRRFYPFPEGQKYYENNNGQAPWGAMRLDQQYQQQKDAMSYKHHT